jgi:CheY-specific phosphatase CheX
LSKEKVDACLVGFQQDNGYSHADMEALKNDDIEKVVSIMTKVTPPYDELVALVVKNLIRFANTDIAIGSQKMMKEVQVSHIAIQEMQGDYSVLLGLACDNEELLSIAIPYGREEFKSLDLDALDAVGEFINCTNGLYASKLSQENVELDMLPPTYKENATMTAEVEFFVLDIQVDGQWIQLIISMKHNQV